MIIYAKEHRANPRNSASNMVKPSSSSFAKEKQSLDRLKVFVKGKTSASTIEFSTIVEETSSMRVLLTRGKILIDC